jgi:hypothetical protein
MKWCAFVEAVLRVYCIVNWEEISDFLETVRHGVASCRIMDSNAQYLLSWVRSHRPDNYGCKPGGVILTIIKPSNRHDLWALYFLYIQFPWNPFYYFPPTSFSDSHLTYVCNFNVLLCIFNVTLKIYWVEHFYVQLIHLTMFKLRNRRRIEHFPNTVTPKVTFYMTWLCFSTYTSTKPARLFLMCLFYFYEALCHSCHPSIICIWTEIFKLKTCILLVTTTTVISPPSTHLLYFCLLRHFVLSPVYFSSLYLYSSSRWKRSWCWEFGIINGKFLNSNDVHAATQVD